MAPSPRQLEPRQVRAIIERLPPFAATVGVLVAEPLDEAVAKLTDSGCRVAQIHGGWPTGVWEAMRSWPVIRAVKVRAAEDIAQTDCSEAAALLLDTYCEGLEGGTGLAFDWTVAQGARLGGKPLILAGGLTPENVAEAIATVRPYAVDVSSGVESAPGRKDAEKMRRFVEAARAAGELIGDRSRAAR
jgi:phosphoribosylanthranilate isomerase